MKATRNMVICNHSGELEACEKCYHGCLHPAKYGYYHGEVVGCKEISKCCYNDVSGFFVKCIKKEENADAGYKSSDLLACPFCGGFAREEQIRGSFGGYGLTSIYCQECGASVSNREVWNARVK